MSLSLDEKRKVVIAMHTHPDLDALVSAWLLAYALRRESHGQDHIQFVFIPGGTTYKGIKPRFLYTWYSDEYEAELFTGRKYPLFLYEEHEGTAVYHVDLGGSLLDNHMYPDGEMLSSAQAVWEYFEMETYFPEFADVVRYVNRVDQGNGFGVGYFASELIGSALLWEEQGIPQKVINERLLSRVHEWILAVSATGKRKLRAAELEVYELEYPLPSSPKGFFLAKKRTRAGVLGVAVSPDQKMVGPATHQLGKCAASVSVNGEKGFIRILFSDKLASATRISVLKMIREAEAGMRGIALSDEDILAANQVDAMPVWFSHVDNGDVIGILNGSPKAPFMDESHKTVLSLTVIVSIVEQALNM